MRFVSSKDPKELERSVFVRTVPMVAVVNGISQRSIDSIEAPISQRPRATGRPNPRLVILSRRRPKSISIATGFLTSQSNCVSTPLAPPRVTNSPKGIITLMSIKFLK